MIDSKEWKRFLESLESLDDPLVVGIFKSVKRIKRHVDTFELCWQEKFLFFSDTLTELSSLWMPLLNDAFGQTISVIYNFCFIDDIDSKKKEYTSPTELEMNEQSDQLEEYGKKWSVFIDSIAKEDVIIKAFFDSSWLLCFSGSTKDLTKIGVLFPSDTKFIAERIFKIEDKWLPLLENTYGTPVEFDLKLSDGLVEKKTNERLIPFNEYLLIKEAADFLGVAANTLRNWEDRGIVSVYRNPKNNYRLYKKRELADLLRL
jgi:hypothetical protein